jgi:hypothetical protein
MVWSEACDEQVNKLVKVASILNVPTLESILVFKILKQQEALQVRE